MKKLRRLGFPLLAVLLYCGSIWMRPLFTPDEIRYAEIPREMLASGDWTTPRMNGMLYFEKPAPGYWPIALAMRFFGERPFAVRLPSAVATLLTALMLVLWGRRGGEPETGKLAALIYLTSGLVFGVGTFAVLDPTFNLFLMLAVVMGFYADTETDRRRQSGYLVLAGLGLGAAFLVKGALAVVLIGTAATVYLGTQGKWRRLWLGGWLPLLIAAAVALPWSLAIHREQPDFWRQFFYVEHVQRFFSGAGANDDRSKPFWFYLPVLLGGALPWLLLLPAAVKRLWPERKAFFARPAFRLAAVTAGVWLVIFSCSRAKLGTYVLPCFPGLALLLAAGLRRCALEGEFRLIDRTLRYFACLVLGCALAFFILHTCGRFGLIKTTAFLVYEAHEPVLVPVLAPVVLAWWLLLAAAESDGIRKFREVALGVGVVMLLAHGFLPRTVVRNQAPEAFLKRLVAPALTSDTLIAAEKAMIPAACWSFKRTGIAIYERPGELKYGMEAAKVVPLKAADVANLNGRRPVVVLTRSKRLTREAPSPKTVISSGAQHAVLYPGGGGGK